ncbi:MAG: hypothetical protein ACQKBU_12680 [Verrucomicrobiales bacterium]
MKGNSLRGEPVVERFHQWVEAPFNPCTLVVGARCRCDLPAVERSICRFLNRVRELGGLPFHWLDFQDIRFLSGQPEIRRSVLENRAVEPSGREGGNDLESVIRGLAGMGGWVLGGQAALDATEGLANTCRIMLCDCRDSQETERYHDWIDTRVCRSSSFSLVATRKFLDWMAGCPCARGRLEDEDGGTAPCKRAIHSSLSL